MDRWITGRALRATLSSPLEFAGDPGERLLNLERLYNLEGHERCGSNSTTVTSAILQEEMAETLDDRLLAAVSATEPK
ncbi:hypothetical protein LVJ94_29590 [Pendulispora rubella]|uniref:Uncharacterized protein n=1 Tax=Pendulispora rubella TaxID=2741070 RepID=A0ABZ2KVN4_9BACT